MCYIGNGMAFLFLPSTATVFSLGFSQQRELKTLLLKHPTYKKKADKDFWGWNDREL